MGRKWKKAKKEAKRPQQKGVPLNYEEISKTNPLFENYYKLQGIIGSDGEWAEFLETLKRPLPATLRITSSRNESQAMLHLFEEEMVKSVLETAPGEEEIDSEFVPPTHLPWYPNKLAWQFNLTRSDIKKKEAHYKLHNFLINETESGNISRQEAVSMIPPLVLKVEPHHKCLDMCASPGSKTAQIIEDLHKNDERIPSGFVIANDIDNKRCYMLIHQAKRLNSPAILISNHDASAFPDLFLKDPSGEPTPLKFDRILCDVPCTGDGTLRKNIDIWRKWAPVNAFYLHGTQYLILRRALELLEIGGRIVYSTCSLNPIEDEAVIHRMLKDGGGSVQLEDIHIPNLKYNKGVSSWVVCSKDLIPLSPDSIPKGVANQILPSMFPPTPEEAGKYHLDKCIRLLPHHQDTGGFFVASLVKTGPLPWESSTNDGPEATSTSEEVQIEKKEESKPKKNLYKLNKMQGYTEDPFFILKEDDPFWPEVVDFYGMDLSRELKHGNFLTRKNEGKARNIYITNDLIREVVQNNEKNLKIINTGIKAFVRMNTKWSNCSYRLAQDGLQVLTPYMNSRKITLSREDLINILVNDDERKPAKMESLSEEARIQLGPLGKGSLPVFFSSPGINGGPPFKFEIAGWKGETSLRGYLAMGDRIHFLRLIGGDVSLFEKKKPPKEESTKAEGNGTGQEESKGDVDSEVDIAEPKVAKIQAD